MAIDHSATPSLKPEYEDSDLTDSTAIPILLTILGVAIVASLLVCLLTFVLLYLVKFRTNNKISYLVSLIIRAEKCLSLQVYSDETIVFLSKLVEADMEILHDERKIFERHINGEPEYQGDIKPGRGLLSKTNEFKVPQNIYDEASFNDKEYQTLHMKIEEDVFLNKKDLPNSASANK